MTLSPNGSLSSQDLETYMRVQEQVRRDKARRRFDSRHGEGATATMYQLADNGQTLSEIAKHFSLSVARMSIIWQDIDGETFSLYRPTK